MDHHIDQLSAMRAALKDACDLLEGWVLTKCPARYRGEHMQHIQTLRAAGQVDASSLAQQAAQPVAFDFIAHLKRQVEFSFCTFGPGRRVEGITDHIAKELVEVRESGGDLGEWIDVVILGLDGCWRSGATAELIVEALQAKQAKNERRVWPDWRTADPGKAIEHDRSADGTEEHF